MNLLRLGNKLGWRPVEGSGVLLADGLILPVANGEPRIRTVGFDLRSVFSALKYGINQETIQTLQRVANGVVSGCSSLALNRHPKLRGVLSA